MSEDIYIDVNYLTESERDVILQVLAKDEELRKQEKRRIRCVCKLRDVWFVFNFRHAARKLLIFTHLQYCLSVSYHVPVVDSKPLFLVAR